MKTIKITKSTNLESSALAVLVNKKKIDMEKLNLTISLQPGDILSLKQMWCGSKAYDYGAFEDGATYKVDSVLQKSLAWLIVVLTFGGALLFYRTLNFLFFVPSLLLVSYLTLYLTLFKNRYLFLQKL